MRSNNKVKLLKDLVPPLSNIEGYVALLLVVAIAIPAFLIGNFPIKGVLNVFAVVPAFLLVSMRFKAVVQALKKSPEVLLLVFALTYWASSTLWSEGPQMFSSYARRLLVLYVFFISVVYLAQYYHQRFVLFIDFSFLLIGVGAVFQLLYFYAFLGSDLSYRLGSDSAFGGAIHAGHYYGFFLSYGVMRLFANNDAWRWDLFFASTACLACVIMAQSRGVSFSFIAMLVIMPLLMRGGFKIKPYAIMLLVLAGLSLFFPQFWLERGLSFRLDIWKESMNLIADNFWFGQGFGPELSIDIGIGVIFAHAHNLYLDTFVRSGVIGLLLLLSMLAIVLVRGFSARKVDAPFVAGVLFFCIGMITDVQKLINSPNELWIVLWLPLLVLSSNIGRLKGTE